MSNEINGSFLDIEETNKRTGEVLTLSSTSETSVQVIPLMRLGVFVPTLKSTNKASLANKKGIAKNTVDASADLRHLTVVRSEGFDNVTISGPRLDMDTDFKIWVGIISVLTDNAMTVDGKGQISLSFSDFAKRCGYPRARMKAELREKIKGSLKKIMSTIVEFSKDKGTDTEKTKLVQLMGESTIDIANDIAILTPSASLKELYASEYRVLLKMKALKKLSRKESAQALYLFFEGLPTNPVPVKIDRLRQRLNLNSRPALQNATIRKALEQLSEIGYLEYQELKSGRDIAFHIIKRNPTLK